MRRRPVVLSAAVVLLLVLGSASFARSEPIPVFVAQLLRVDADGSDLQQVLQADLALGFRAIDVDPVGQRIYWAGFGEPLPDPLGFGGLIRRIDVGGGVIEEVVVGEGGVKVDPFGGKVYFTVGSDCDPCTTVYRSNLDGSNTQMLAGDNSFTPLAVDPAGGKFYRYHEGSIVVADLDGTGAQPLITPVAELAALAVDSANQKLYWMTYAGALRRASLDGTGAEDLVTGLSDPGGLVLDPPGDRLWWTEGAPGRIRRARLDGSDVTTIRSGLIDPRGIAYLPDAGGDGRLYLLSNPQTITLPVPATGTGGAVGLVLLLLLSSGLALRNARRRR